MVHSRRSETQEVAEEREEGQRKEDFGITLLGLPMLAGPGAITAAMVLMGQSRLWWQSVLVFLSILATSVITFYVLAAGARIRRRLGETGVGIMQVFESHYLPSIDVGRIPASSSEEVVIYIDQGHSV